MQKELPLDATVLETLVSAAVAAPSIHNTQPWRFHADESTRTIEVHADLRRSLPITDPTGRALHLSVGAAVLNLRVAATHLGWDPVLHLLPRASDPGLLATVRLAGPPRTPPLPRTGPVRIHRAAAQQPSALHRPAGARHRPGRAGRSRAQALERVLLLATFNGMRASMLYQALEWADLRWLLRDPTMAGESEPQMLLRIGYGPQGPATPRRSARDAMV